MSLAVKQPRPKMCKNPACGISFQPQRLGQAVCSPACALAIKDVNQQKARKSLAQVERKEIKVRKEKLKSRAEHLREAQAAVNEFIAYVTPTSRASAAIPYPAIMTSSQAADGMLATIAPWARAQSCVLSR